MNYSAVAADLLAGRAPTSARSGDSFAASL
jgi:hypothetical protein